MTFESASWLSFCSRFRWSSGSFLVLLGLKLRTIVSVASTAAKSGFAPLRDFDRSMLVAAVTPALVMPPMAATESALWSLLLP